MAKGDHPGEFEQTVLLLLARLREPATGRKVYEELLESTRRDVALATIHVTLRRLEAKGLVDVRMQPGPEGLGREVKHFGLTEAGVEALQEAREHWERLWQGARRHPDLRDS